MEGNMNGEKPQGMFEENLIPLTNKLNLGRRWVFRQDNNPKDTTKITQEGIAWLNQALDFNSIETLRMILKL